VNLLVRLFLPSVAKRRSLTRTALISREDYDDLELVRKVRNEAAHSIYEFSLEDPGVKSLVLQLKTADRAKVKNDSLQAVMSETKCHFINNGMALFIIISEKLADALERELERREQARFTGSGLIGDGQGPGA